MKQITLGNNLKKLSKVLILKKIKCTNFASRFKYNLIAILFALPMFLQAQTSKNLNFMVGQYSGTPYSYNSEISKNQISITKEGVNFYMQIKGKSKWLLTPKYDINTFSLGRETEYPGNLKHIYDNKGKVYLGFIMDSKYYFLNKNVVGNIPPKTILRDSSRYIKYSSDFPVHKFNLKDIFSNNDNDELTYFISKTFEANSLFQVDYYLSPLDIKISPDKLTLDVKINETEGSYIYNIYAVDNKGGLAVYTFNIYVIPVFLNSEGYEDLVYVMYPNPTKDGVFNISDVSNFYSIDIYDSYGALVSPNRYKVVNNSMQTREFVYYFGSDIIGGTYFVRFTNKVNKKVTRKQLIYNK